MAALKNRIIAKVAVSAAIFSIDRPYSYLVPEEFHDRIAVGYRVIVPFGRGNRRCEGVILAVEEEQEHMTLKAIDTLVDPEPVLTEDQIQLALWMRERFFCTFYDAVHAMLPAGMWFKEGKDRIGDKTQKFAWLAISTEDALVAAEQKKLRAPQQSAILRLLASVGEAACADICSFTGASQSSLTALINQGLVESEVREVMRSSLQLSDPDAEPIALNPSQKEAYDGLVSQLRSPKAEAALLYGVTGSGKTSVYIELVRETVKMGRTAIVLVPEIGLTPQFVSVFSSHFGRKIALIHSSLSMGERYDVWKQIRAGTVDVVIGTRSAVFAPVENLGLIIIDEEQEHTYKSENSPRYHTRDIAKYRCAKSNALLLMGSATPSVDSMYFAKMGRYKLYTLHERYNNRPLPPVMIADMRAELKKGNGGVISELLRDELQKNIDAGRQSILFLNRRGASNAIQCGECGHTFECPRCSVSMTYHSVGNRLLCHYCGHTEPLPDRCPECGGKFKHIGAGTQKVEEELRELFPGIEIIRMDTDTVGRTGSHDRLLKRFREEKVPILLGTQMITKGLDFENVTLVGVLSADQLMYAGDYRAHENAFSLMTQVVGRSGRGEQEGRAVIQTFTPDNELIALAANQDYFGFYEREMDIRRLSSAPPIKEMISITVSGLQSDIVRFGCMDILEALEHYTKGIKGVQILGPVPAGVAKVNNRYRYKITILSDGGKEIRNIVSHQLHTFADNKSFRGLAAYADYAPIT